MLYDAARKRMWDVVESELEDQSPSIKEYPCKLIVKPDYSTCNGIKSYFGSVSIRREALKPGTDHIIPARPSDFGSTAVSTFVLEKHARCGQDIYTITHGRTGNRTLFESVVAVAADETNAREKLENLIIDVVNYMQSRTGDTRTPDHAIKALAQSPRVYAREPTPYRRKE